MMNEMKRRPVILIVDDAPSVLETLGAVLKEAGYEVATAADSRQALRLIDAGPPDLIISEIMMPSQGGYRLFRELLRPLGIRLPLRPPGLPLLSKARHRIAALLLKHPWALWTVMDIGVAVCKPDDAG